MLCRFLLVGVALLAGACHCAPVSIDIIQDWARDVASHEEPTDPLPLLASDATVGHVPHPGHVARPHPGDHTDQTAPTTPDPTTTCSCEPQGVSWQVYFITIGVFVVASGLGIMATACTAHYIYRPPPPAYPVPECKSPPPAAFEDWRTLQAPHSTETVHRPPLGEPDAPSADLVSTNTITATVDG